MRILILGGTADGRKLAESLHQQGFSVIYSVAGLVRYPKVSCEVISGGFTQFGGLAHYLSHKSIELLIDATHPYAAIMSTTAIAASQSTQTPCWRFHRPAWEPSALDNWHHFHCMSTMVSALHPYQSVLFSCGQITQDIARQLSSHPQQQQLFRTASKPRIQIPASMSWVQAIGPFDLHNELTLLQEYNIDVIVSKNSGGNSTAAKLLAAQQLTIPVFMLQRPKLPLPDKVFYTQAALEEAILPFSSFEIFRK